MDVVVRVWRPTGTVEEPPRVGGLLSKGWGVVVEGMGVVVRVWAIRRWRKVCSRMDLRGLRGCSRRDERRGTSMDYPTVEEALFSNGSPRVGGLLSNRRDGRRGTGVDYPTVGKALFSNGSPRVEGLFSKGWTLWYGCGLSDGGGRFPNELKGGVEVVLEWVDMDVVVTMGGRVRADIFGRAGGRRGHSGWTSEGGYLWT